MLNYKLLIVCICIIIALTLYLFYWNRFVGFALTRTLRLLLWTQGKSAESIWVDVGSIHISILAGRILVKDVAYHSSNQTLRIVKGQISWRYWIRVPADEDDLNHARVVGEDVGLHAQKAPLSCRLHISLQGLEWFIYNRTAAYDSVVSAMHSNFPDASEAHVRMSGEGIGSLRKIFSWTSVVPESTHLGPPVSLVSSIYSRTPEMFKKWSAGVRRQLPSLDPKDLLPIGIEVAKGAIIIGNRSTPELLVAEFRSTRGTYGIVPARSRYDQYKQVMQLTFQNTLVSFAENKQYEGSMTEMGEKLHANVQRSETQPLRIFSYLSFSAFAKLWRRHKLWNIINRRQSHNPLHNASSWSRRRAEKAKEEETPLGINFATLEYAKEAKVLEAPFLDLLYYADSVGVVPRAPDTDGVPRLTEDPMDIGNGDLPPEWGVDLAIRGGVLRYGPWTDRQRVLLQHVFFPPSFTDMAATTPLRPGDPRVWTCMKVLIELRDGVMLQIPFRESSKNWMWDGEVNVPNRPRRREPASIHVRAGDSSTISYMMPMIATAQGYEPTLHVHLDTLTITSSLNDIRVLTAESCVIRAELPSPLKWNDQRQWTFAISLRQPVFYLLRDHVNMFTDLAKDWTSGPPSHYERFVPMVYNIDIDVQNYEINTYVNDHNIIDKPLIREENAILTLYGKVLKNSVIVPMTKFRPETTKVIFWIEGCDVQARLTLPRWNTRSLYSGLHRNSDLGRIGFLRLDASYSYFADVHPENIDQLKLSFQTHDVIHKLCGWTIRHFMILRNNYFGSFTHFSTLYEYLEKRKQGQPLGDPVDLQYREGGSNAMQIELDVSVPNGLVIMPVGLRGYESDQHEGEDPDMGTCVVMSLPELQIHLRSHEYFMELALNVDTITGSIHKSCLEDLRHARELQRNAKETIVLDGLDIVAHRLFGPQPHTATYLCIWDIRVDRVMVHLSSIESKILSAASNAFALNFTDPLNAPAPEYDIPADPDVTFLKIALGEVAVIWQADRAALEFRLPNGLRVDNNDLAGKLYSKVTSLRIPDASLKLLLANDAVSNGWHEAGSAELDADIDIYSAPLGWRERAQAQAEFLAAQDGHTCRALFLYMPNQPVPNDTLAPGRGILDTDLYLPQLRIPSSTPAARARQRPWRRATGPANFVASSAPRAKARLRGVSDSEGEEGISEADRDARLAKSRPPPVHLPDVLDDEDISSGDEEDDDSTDAYQSDSDEEDRGTKHNDWPHIRDYNTTTRQYESRFLAHPSLWHQSPYVLTSDPSFTQRSNLRDKLHEWVCEDEVDRELEDVRLDFDDTSDNTVIRITSCKPINIRVTPLVLPVIDQLLKDVKIHQLSPDLLLDTIIARHIRSVSGQTKARKQASALDLSVFALHLSLSQSIPDPSARAGYGPSLQHSTTSMDICANAFRFKNCKVTSESGLVDSQCLGFHFQRFACGLDSTNSLEVTWHIFIGASNFALLGQNISLCLGAVLTETRHSAPELVVPTVLATLRLVCGLRASLASYDDYSRSSDQQVVLKAIQLVGRRDVVDPLSTTQPSYLIQSGRPRDLRADVGFKYLVFLRRCLEALTGIDRQILREASAQESTEFLVEDAMDLLQEYLVQFGADMDSLSFSNSSPLGFLAARPSPPDPIPCRELCSLSLRFQKIHATYISPDGSDSEVLVAPVVVNARSRLTEWYEPHAMSPPKSTTTLSLGDKHGQGMRHISVVVSLGAATITLSPSLMIFVQHVIHEAKVHKKALITFTPRSPPVEQLSTQHPPRPLVTYVDFVLTTSAFRVKAAAQNLVIEYRASAVDFVGTSLIKPPVGPKGSLDVSTNHSLVFREARLQGYSLADMSSPEESAVLAALVFSGGKLNVLARYQSDSRPVIQVVVGLDSLYLNVPRSAIRLYRWAQEWRADYLPGLEETFRALLAELKPDSRSSTPIATVPVQPGLPIAAWIPRNVDVTLKSFRVSLQVMRGTWVAWEVANIMAYMVGTASSRGTKRRNFGMQIGRQTFIISTKDSTSESVRVKMPLPTFTATGLFDGASLDCIVLIETFTVNVKPSHWDTLLTVQQKFGQDFSDLVSLIEHSRPKPAGEKTTSASSRLKYHVQAKMKGFCVGLEGASSAILLECDRIGGMLLQNGTGISGTFDLSDLALSLAPRTSPSSPVQSFDRGRRSAFVIIDVNAEMGNSKDRGCQVVHLAVTKIHAVMQPSSIGQLGDFVDHLQAEISIRREQRAQDLAEFKEKTKTLLRSLELTMSNPQSESSSWINKYIINVSVKNVGVAFPLTIGEGFHGSRPVKPGDAAVRAFLFSIKSISFDTHRGETGQACMKGFSFQFVSRFRQSEPADFCGDRHTTRNRLVYPEMTAQLKSERKPSSRELHIAADVDGFNLDVDSSIPDYVSSLIDVYREGKNRVDRFSGASTRVVAKEEPSPDTPRASEHDYTNLLTSHVFMALSFKSGRVRMFSHAYSLSSRPRLISTHSPELLDRQLGELGAEVFKLPGVSVWGEYRATPALSKMSRKQGPIEPSTLIFKSTVHSSQNTLRPTLLPFLTEVMNHVESRMKKTNLQDMHRLPIASSPATPFKQLDHLPMPVETASSMQISLSLRIDQSRLELTCQPDVNVIAGLHWDSGGFVVNISPGAHRVTFSGNVGGLTIGLKHGFLSEDCVSLHARNLVFSVDFSKARGTSMSSVSVVCDTEFSGGVRFSRLQDVLCFKAVWLDRIPVLNVPPATPATMHSRTPSQQTPSISLPSQRQELTTALLLRLRKVSLDIDLGQSITSTQLNVHDAVLRTKVTDVSSEVSLSVSELYARATGNLSGRLAVPNFLFQTARKKERDAFRSSKSNMLDLQMTSGPLDIELESEYQRLLWYRAEPLIIRIYDDWSRFSASVQPQDRQIQLTFTVSGSDVTAIMNVGTIPKLVSYANKFKATLDAQKEGASRESLAFRQSNPAKPENPLSDVANAMLLSARAKLTETEPGLACGIGQGLILKLHTLKLVIFPRSMRDPELAQFIGTNVHARLDRVVVSECVPPKRELHLAFSSISISKLSHLNLSLVSKEEPDLDTVRWLSLLTKNASEAIIFTLPSMQMRMYSEESLEDVSRILLYDFSSKFAKKENMRDEDIYITLNMALYAWLTILRKTFAREMEQVQASAEVRAPQVGLAQPSALRRSKLPEPLIIVPEREGSGSGTHLDDLAQSPRRAGLPHTKSTPARFPLMSPTAPEWTVASPTPMSPVSKNSDSSQGGPARNGTLLTSSPVEEGSSRAPSPGLPASKKTMGIVYRPRSRRIERLTMRQLGEATPDVMHPFFMKTAGFSLEDSLPQYVHEYATMPTEEIMKALLKLYSKQLRADTVVEPNT
ncbi:hypothetical protein PsYK624_116400 [Phanerochaete sordida]|uniref:Csf1 N-terminal domain-containing protein n=1 Tax=Phanerochaete sordida TaxID=48140 RepID=A0A9P3LHE4_9APHY|nr:hypothetical protein PsYK624_116400 [Phanerochaete sordida]